MSEKPLNVRVAEALGCEPIEDDGYEPHRFYCGCDPLTHATPGELPRLVRYDTDWSATGPLIERYGIDLTKLLGSHCWLAEGQPDGWLDSAEGPTPLLAVCNLILALHAAGKLPQT